MDKILVDDRLCTPLVMGSGYGLMVGLTPSDEDLYNKLSPDLKRRVDKNRQEREKAEMAVSVSEFITPQVS